MFLFIVLHIYILLLNLCFKKCKKKYLTKCQNFLKMNFFSDEAINSQTFSKGVNCIFLKSQPFSKMKL